MKYRPTISILQAILESVDGESGATISQISVDANVSHSRLQDKIEELLEADILEENPAERKGSSIYVLTPKGKQALLKIREFTSFLSSFGILPPDGS